MIYENDNASAARTHMNVNSHTKLAHQGNYRQSILIVAAYKHKMQNFEGN